LDALNSAIEVTGPDWRFEKRLRARLSPEWVVVHAAIVSAEDFEEKAFDEYLGGGPRSMTDDELKKLAHDRVRALLNAAVPAPFGDACWLDGYAVGLAVAHERLLKQSEERVAIDQARDAQLRKMVDDMEAAAYRDGGQTMTKPREEIERARDAAALEAMFFWQLADREKSAKWQRKADECASAAMRLDEELNKP
jgi:hypothetical protein